MQIIKTTELPRDVQALIKTYGFNVSQVRLHPTVDFTCPTSYCDYNILTLVAYNQGTGKHHAVRNGHYESCLNWTKEERAMASGEIRTKIENAEQWFLVMETYPRQRVAAYCHPSALAAAIELPKVALTRRQEICLFVTRAIKAPYRLDEARTFRFTKTEWETTKAELYGLGLLSRSGTLTLAGKNRAIGLVFHAWEEDKRQQN